MTRPLASRKRSVLRAGATPVQRTRRRRSGTLWTRQVSLFAHADTVSLSPLSTCGRAASCASYYNASISSAHSCFSAKYPLAISHSLLDVLGDEGILQLGYDIGCAHSGTAGRSSFGDRVKALIRFVVGSFHGHAHNRPCQLGFHPRYIEGSGREDFETCERIFSVTNLIAALIRHATPFHRHEDMDRAFTASDAEKYAAIGACLFAFSYGVLTHLAARFVASRQVQGRVRQDRRTSGVGADH